MLQGSKLNPVSNDSAISCLNVKYVSVGWLDSIRGVCVEKLTQSLFVEVELVISFRSKEDRKGYVVSDVVVMILERMLVGRIFYIFWFI